jgi:ParB-like chromosome segregation protein Spo0J
MDFDPDDRTMSESRPADDSVSIVKVPISSLVAADSPRLGGEDIGHVRVLMESGANLPPIIVQRATMRVIDGMHRVRAARLRGDNEITVQYFDGDDDAAFLLAVRKNVAHGLPLTLADRRSAAARIIQSHPMLSDRAIATASGLSPKTVGALRPKPTESADVAVARIGRDGRVRSLNYAEGRRIASEHLSHHPNASLRDVARTAGVSARTARDVRNRLGQGQEVPAPRRPVPVTAAPGPGGTRRRRPSSTESADILRNLRGDPSLRLTESGRALIRLLDTQMVWARDSERVVEHLPAHCIGMLVELAAACVETWRDFAERLETRERDLMSHADDG